MFEHYTEANKQRRHRRLTWILSVSFAGHMTAATALIVAGMWHIDKLLPPTRTVVLTLPPRLVKTTEPAPMKPMKPAPRPQTEPHKPKTELVQPDDNAPELQPDDLVEYGALEELSNGSFTDADGGGTGAAGYSAGSPFGDGVSFAEVEHITPIPEPPGPARVIDVTEKFLEGRRISGNAWILPPQSTRAAMHRNDIRKIRGMVKMCLDIKGRVKTLRTLRTIGYPAYDRKLLREMRHWRYRPYSVNGQPVGMCTVITFIYKVID